MTGNVLPRFLLLIFFLMVLHGCASTHIRSVWKNPDYISRPQKVLVVAIMKEPVYRRIVEDEFVLQFRLRGIEALASYVTLSDRQQENDAAIEELVKQAGADTVLITRMVNRRTVRVYYPPNVTYRPHNYRRWPEYYRYGHEYMVKPGYSTEYEYALMETNLYDLNLDHLVWAATTETGVEKLNQGLIKPYIGNLLNLMSDSGIVRANPY